MPPPSTVRVIADAQKALICKILARRKANDREGFVWGNAKCPLNDHHAINLQTYEQISIRWVTRDYGVGIFSSKLTVFCVSEVSSFACAKALYQVNISTD